MTYLKSLDYDIQALEISVKKLHEAIIKSDSVALRNLTTEELTYGHSTGLIDSRESFMNSLLSGQTDVSKIDVKNQEITIKGDVAWVRSNTIIELIEAANKRLVDLKMLYVWVKEKGFWRLLARQAVR